MRGFERYVNSKDNQTSSCSAERPAQFERYVNSKDNQTTDAVLASTLKFERYVNSKDNQTYPQNYSHWCCLRDM